VIYQGLSLYFAQAVLAGVVHANGGVEKITGAFL